MVWYTCQRCPPHAMADHSIYGDKRCLCKMGEGDCPCPGFVPDLENPVKPKIRKPLTNPLPQS